ncbi:unnamed protein product [Pleuronectes platessa]|uniref:Uncharacterized protein n=1 Tax=Pleuronectes platessa TaxID=8262 RepID=A0A9N7THM2_PLEPL|nr:unnamed protein product [Pleuronectes platessa]
MWRVKLEESKAVGLVFRRLVRRRSSSPPTNEIHKGGGYTVERLEKSCSPEYNSIPPSTEAFRRLTRLLWIGSVKVLHHPGIQNEREKNPGPLLWIAHLPIYKVLETSDPTTCPLKNLTEHFNVSVINAWKKPRQRTRPN